MLVQQSFLLVLFSFSKILVGNCYAEKAISYINKLVVFYSNVAIDLYTKMLITRIVLLKSIKLCMYCHYMFFIFDTHSLFTYGSKCSAVCRLIRSRFGKKKARHAVRF